MKNLLKLSASALAIMLMTTGVQAEGKLSLYNWFEYMPQALLDKFAKEHNVEVTMDTYDSNETMLAALKAGKLGSYDLAVPSDYMVAIMGTEGMLDTFEPSRQPGRSSCFGFNVFRHSSVQH